MNCLGVIPSLKVFFLNLASFSTKNVTFLVLLQAKHLYVHYTYMHFKKTFLLCTYHNKVNLHFSISLWHWIFLTRKCNLNMRGHKNLLKPKQMDKRIIFCRCYLARQIFSNVKVVKDFIVLTYWFRSCGK